jgi:hypothetical protein
MLCEVGHESFMYNLDEQDSSKFQGLMANQFNSEANSTQLRIGSLCLNDEKMSAGYD